MTLGHVRVWLAGSLVFAAGSGCFRDLAGPDFQPFCAIESSSSIVAFEDAILAAEIRDDLSVGPQDPLICGLVETLTTLSAASAGIVSLSGIENLTGLTTLQIRDNAIADISPLSRLTGLTSLNLAANSITDVSALSGLTNLTGTLWIYNNAITDIGPLSGLTNLTALNAWDNSITDLSALSGLTSLTALRVSMNSITNLGDLSGLTNLELVSLHTNPDLSDIQTLLDNPGLGPGDAVQLKNTSVNCTDVDALRAKIGDVISDCP